MRFNPKNCSGSEGGSRALLGWGRRGRRAGRSRDLAFPELLARFWGIADTSVLAGAAWVSWQRWLREIREQPQEAKGDGWLGILPDLSSDYFLQNKRHYFRTGNLHFGALHPPLLSVSLPHAHVFCCLGGF